MSNKDKWKDVDHHLCLRCGEFMCETERWVCCRCDESDDAQTWTLMYGNLFVCASCGDLFEDREEKDLNRYCCTSCCR